MASKVYASIFVVCALLATVAVTKPVANKKTRQTTPAPPPPEDDGLDKLLNAGLLNLGGGVTCDSWIDSKIKSMNTNVEDLAKMIVDAEPKELALEFIVFCLMDDQPMSDRPNMLKLAIDEEKQTVVTTPKPPVKQPKHRNNARKI